MSPPEFEDWKQVLMDRQAQLDMTSSQLNVEFASVTGRRPKNTNTIIRRVLLTDGNCNIDTFLALVEALGGVVVIRWDNNDEHKISHNTSI